LPSISRSLSRCYKNLGYNISVRELRHTYSTGLVAQGLDFKTIAKLMGHDLQQTIKPYSHVTNDMMKRATKIINENFKKNF
jgi:Site-specific recombinase XerD